MVFSEKHVHVLVRDSASTATPSFPMALGGLFEVDLSRQPVRWVDDM